MKTITGGVTAPQGFQAAGIHCGVKDNFATPKPEKKDLAMVLSDVPCAAAGTFTRNVVKASPVLLTMDYLSDGPGRHPRQRQRQRLRPERDAQRRAHGRGRRQGHRPPAA